MYVFHYRVTAPSCLAGSRYRERHQGPKADTSIVNNRDFDLATTMQRPYLQLLSGLLLLRIIPIACYYSVEVRDKKLETCAGHRAFVRVSHRKQSFL